MYEYFIGFHNGDHVSVTGLMVSGWDSPRLVIETDDASYFFNWSDISEVSETSV